MRAVLRLALAPALVAGLAAFLLVLGASFPGNSAHAQGETSIGIDADPTGNTATSLGARDVCVSVGKGATFQVDVIVQNVADLLAWEAYLAFDPDVVQVKDRSVQQLLASAPDSNPFDLSESVPDDVAPYRVGAVNMTEQPQGISGSGILARLTFEAQGKGVSSLSLGPIRTEAGPIGPTLTAVDGSQIGDSNDDSYFDGPILDAQVAVDQPCPGGEGVSGPAVLAGGGGGGGIGWWVFLVAALGIVATAGFGGIAFIVLRRAGSNPAS